MPKNGKISIEADERKIIDQLLKDSRQSPHEIAKRLGFSRQKVWRIINKLEKDNVIWGYSAVIDENSIGRNTYFALARTKAPFHDILDFGIKRIKGNNIKKIDINLIGLFYLNGTYDWLIVFSAKSVADAKRNCGYIQEYYGKYIDRIELLENVFTMVRFGKINPNVEKFKEFAVF
jgi:DNA-binding Lrp family transcriptional regulator